jgi:undecaprenyl-diphosphatase
VSTANRAEQPLAIILADGAFALVLLVLIVAIATLLPFTYQMAITLGVVQGLSEFLPLSSSAHLILTSWFLGWPIHSRAVDIAIHVGALGALAGYFWRDWLLLLRAAPRPQTPEGRLFWLLLLGAIPGGIFGVLFDRQADLTLRSPWLLAGMLVVGAAVLFVADRWGQQKRELLDIGVVDALLIGVTQALAIVPGLSRFGITIAVARARGIERVAAARFSFLLGSPILMGATLLKLRPLGALRHILSAPFVVGVVAAAAVGAFCIGLLLRYLREADFRIFVVYRLLLAGLIVTTLLVGLR